MKIGGRPEPVSAAKLLDDLWLEVICLTNLEIAGSPRNTSRRGLVLKLVGGRALNGFEDASL